MKLMYDFEKMSRTWHYDRKAEPQNELRNCGKVMIDDGYANLINEMLASPVLSGGKKRIHSGDPALDVKNKSISERSSHMRKIGFNESHYFYEFNDERFLNVVDDLRKEHNISHYHYCSIIVPPGQCMPAHGDTYGYLQRYMSSDYPDVEYTLEKNACRYLVFLTDWSWGQTFGAGNMITHQWKKGDVYQWDHRLIHWCSNSGFDPFVFFEITGLQL